MGVGVGGSFFFSMLFGEVKLSLVHTATISIVESEKC